MRWPWEEKRNRLEEALDCEDRGEVKNGTNNGKFFYTVCAACKSRAHVVIKSDGKRSYACPQCLCFVLGWDDTRDDDQEEKWLRAHKDIFGDKP